MMGHPIPFNVEFESEDLIRVLDLLLSAGFKVSASKWLEAGLKGVLPTHIFDSLEFVSRDDGTCFYAAAAGG